MLWDNDSPLLDGSVSSLNTKSEVWWEVKFSLVKWPICSWHHCLTSSLSQSFLENPSRVWPQVEPWSDCEASRHWNCPNEGHVTLQDRDVAANREHDRNLALRFFRDKSTPRALFPHSVKCGKAPRLGQFSKNQLKPSVTSIFKHFQKPRMLSATQEWLCQAVVKWRSVQAFGSKKKWEPLAKYQFSWFIYEVCTGLLEIQQASLCWAWGQFTA